MGSPPPARPLYLDAGAERMFALFHPVSGTARTAVLLCPPFGWEDICSYRSRREWAQRLAADGHPTLRFDLPGSGDSTGGPDDPSRPDAWTLAVSVAARWLRHTSGARRVAAVGIGLTGTAVLRAALEGAAIDELVLWGVPARGRTAMRALRAFARMEVANVGGEEIAAAQPGEEGELVVNGYRLSASTAMELEQLDLSQELVEQTSSFDRVLLLERDGLKLDEQLHSLLVGAGASVTVANGPGYGDMMREPQDAQAPLEVFDLLDTWLAEGEGVGGSDAQASRSIAPAEHPTMEFDHVGSRLRETPVYVDRGEDGRLFGILCEPLGERQELCAVLLNAGPQRHTGPNRMWVEIARRWAALGVPTLRVDLAAIGDSDGDASTLVRVASLYAPEYVEQTLQTLDMLQERGLPSRFVMLGLCSGAYWSMHAALQDERIVGTVMLNPRALIWDEWRYTVLRTRDLRERLLRWSTWKRVLRGEITLARHLETGRSILMRALSSLRTRLRGAHAQTTGDHEGDPVEAMFDAMRDRGQRSLLLLTGKEPLREELAAGGLFERAGRWPNMEIAIRGSEADTHTLTPLWLQRQVHELVDGALQAELQRAALPHVS